MYILTKLYQKSHIFCR